MEPRDDEELSDAGSDEPDVEWLLGFAVPPRRPADLLRHRFPSKVGGRPAWLDPARLPAPDQLVAPATGAPLDFLLQVYAPVDANPAAFHRAVYVFVAPGGAGPLAAPGGARALRCQLPRRNAYYPAEPPGRGDDAPPALPPGEAAAAAAADPWRAYEFERAGAGGGGGGAAAAEPAEAEAETEIEELERGPLAPPRRRLFPELELVVEPEGSDGGSGSECSGGAGAGTGAAAAADALRRYHERAAAEGEYDDDELPGDVVDAAEAGATPAQRQFAAFAARVARAPAQVLRYCFEPGAAPLWPAPPAAGPRPAPAAGDVPRCGRCGGERRFEFQVMPQLLHALGVDAADPAAPDWGTIAVYSCAASCGGGGAPPPDGQSAYVEEFCWVQPMH